jgi:pSer/pThr/pTyr-binding forkhead associated (FHA) protein
MPLAAVSGPVLTLLKYVFLAILYLFFLRVLRSVWVQIREPKAAFTPAPEAPAVALADAAVGPEKLVVIAPDTVKGTEFRLGPEATVGRAGGCAVLLPDDTFVSQLHARMFRRDGDLYVEDLGSTNGTFLNGKKVTTPRAVRKGDRVQFGRTTLEVRK